MTSVFLFLHELKAERHKSSEDFTRYRIYLMDWFKKIYLRE